MQRLRALCALHVTVYVYVYACCVCSMAQVSGWESSISTVLHLCIQHWLGSSGSSFEFDLHASAAEHVEADTDWRRAVTQCCDATLFEQLAHGLLGAPDGDHNTRSQDSLASANTARYNTLLCPFEEPAVRGTTSPTAAGGSSSGPSPSPDSHAPSLDCATKAYDVFSTVLTRPAASAALSTEYKHLVVAALVEVNAVLGLLLECHVDPPAPRGFPFYSGKVAWALSLQRRLDTLVDPVRCVFRPFAVDDYAALCAPSRVTLPSLCSLAGAAASHREHRSHE